MKISVYFGLMLLLILAWGCSDDDDDEQPQPTMNSVRLADNPTLGKILTNEDGLTLYFFSKDTKDNSECLGGCTELWPIFYVENLTLDPGLDPDDFGTITRTDGIRQTTYMGWPLYLFSNDNQAGQTNGDKVNDIWYVAKPDYSLMYVMAQLIGHDGNNYKSDYTLGDEQTKYITDIAGRTLYRFVNDKKDTNNFTNEDFSNNGVWPIAEITIDEIPSILQDTDFGVINVYGRTQLTYRGWPLYYFGQDMARGDNKGISFPVPGIWPIANTDTEMAPEP